MREEDLPTLWEYIYGEKDPEWKKWDAPYFPHEPMDDNSFREGWQRHMADDAARLVIEADGKPIGSVSYYWECKETKWLEVGIVIYNPHYWSHGYGSEALTLWIEEMFNRFPDIARVGLTTWSGNARMVRAAEKIGMQLEGRMRKVRYYNGVYYDSIRMGVLREEWQA